jgi:polysaccharide export outer membrane protein
LAAEIAARLAKDYLQNPQVTIFIEEFTSQRVVSDRRGQDSERVSAQGSNHPACKLMAAAGGPTSVADSQFGPHPAR